MALGSRDVSECPLLGPVTDDSRLTVRCVAQASENALGGVAIGARREGMRGLASWGDERQGLGEQANVGRGRRDDERAIGHAD